MILSDPLALRSVRLLPIDNNLCKPARSIWQFVDNHDVIHFVSTSSQNTVLI